MRSLAAIKVAEAQLLLEDAESRANEEDAFSPSLAMSYAINAVILAVDALGNHHGLPSAKRHDQIQRTFVDMIRDGRLPGRAAKWRPVIIEAINEKSRFQYDGDLTSRSQARRFVRNVAELVAFADEVLRTSPTRS